MLKIEQIKEDLLEIYYQSNLRGLKQSSKWASEMLLSIKSQQKISTQCFHQQFNNNKDNNNFNNTFEQQQQSSTTTINANNNEQQQQKQQFLKHLIIDPEYLFAKSIFDLGEYKRAAYFSKNPDSTILELRFLHYYSKYLSIEKERLDRMIEPTSVIPNYLHRSFIELKNDLEKLFLKNDLIKNDSYMNYLMAIILLKLGLNQDAINFLVKSLYLNPLCWCSWHQLTQILKDEQQMLNLLLPTNWLKFIFLAAFNLEIQSNEEALQIYLDLLKTFEDNNYIRQQMAIANYNLKYFEDSINLFTMVRLSDPFKLDAMDIYSNLLYVKEMQTELSSLAHTTNNIDPFRVETCFCIANFYSLRGQHAKSVVYFSRALQLNPKYLSAWTLMGHEYIELKNTNAAIQAYRSAIKCNNRDYRAWYGLGQAYEILTMPTYSLYYYSKAHFLKPTDTRLILAIGQTYEKLSRYEEAASCYAKAGFSSLIKLANLYERMNEEPKAATVYNEFVKKFELKKSLYNLNLQDLSNSYKFLAFYFYKQQLFKESQAAAEICMHFEDCRDDVKSLLNKLEIEFNKQQSTSTSSTTPIPMSSSSSDQMEM